MTKNKRNKMTKAIKSVDQAFDIVNELPSEQQELLIEKVLRYRTTKRRQQKLVEESKAGLAEFLAGNLNPKTADEAILELRIELDSSKEK
ncbi:MAG: hypothetical protein WA902_02165 [Thermosynechococcaceae cyanobacterium]